VIAAFVEGAGDTGVGDDAVGEWAAAMRAEVVERVPAGGGVEDRDPAAVDGDRAALAERHLVGGADVGAHQGAHRTPSGGGPIKASIGVGASSGGPSSRSANWRWW